MNEKVTVVVLNWNSYADTSRCVRSVQHLDNDLVSIVVVDNGSTDNSGDRINDEFTDVTVVFNDSNLGFGGGMNAGIEVALEAGSDYIWLLNNDVVVPEPTVLKSLLAAMRNGEDVGAVTPMIREPNDDIWFASGYVDERTGDCGHCNPKAVTDERHLENEYVPTCCVLFRADVLEDVGTFDDGYFIYYDDVDHCLRLREAGYRLLTTTETEVVHEGSATSERTGGNIFPYYMSRNWWHLSREHASSKLGFFQSYGVWGVKQVGYYLYHRDFDAAKALLSGTIDGALGRRGKGRYP